MKIVFKRAYALLIVATMIFSFATSAQATQSVSGNFYKSYTLTGNGADDIVAVAQAQLGRSQSSMGYTEAWCADFVSDCARLAGVESLIPFNGGVSYLRNAMLNAGGSIVSSRQKGDIVFYYCSHCGGYTHVGIVQDGTYSIEGNVNGQVYKVGGSNGNYMDVNGHTLSSGISREYIRPNYASVQTSAPTYAVITIDSIEYIFDNYDGSFYRAEITFDFESDNAEETTFILNKYNSSSNCYETYRSYTSSYLYYPELNIYPGLCSSIFDTGKYEAYIIARNSQGEVTSNKVYFNIGYYKLYYDANGGIGVPPLETGVTKVSTITPRKDGYVFVGWSINKNATTAEYRPGDNIFLESDTTLYAVWRSYKLEYSNTSFEAQTGSSSYVIYETYPTKDGYTFLGWSTDRSSGTPEFIPGDTINISSDTVLYPVWKRESTINIYYNANGGKGAPVTQSGKTSYTISDTIPEREGYTFLGWLNFATEKVPDDWQILQMYFPGDTYIGIDITLYAVWCKNEDVKNYTITFDANGGSGAPEKLTGSSFYRIPTTKPTREGYTFLYWGNQSSWSSNMLTYYPNWENNYVNAKQDTTLYAHWREIENVNLYYNANGGGGAPCSQTGEITYTVSSVKPVRKGYVFCGWSTDRDATTAEYQAGDKISLTKNTTLQAVWVPEHECKYSSVITVQPTCTKPGQKKYTCSTCGDYYTEAIPVLAHKIVTDKAVAATCTSTGKTEGKHCSECGTVTVAQTVIPANAHTPGDWEVLVAPTFKAEGTQVRKCTVCKTVLEERSIPVLEKAPEVEIRRTSTTSINYGDTLVLQLEEVEIPEGLAVAWFVEGVGVSTWVSEDGCECRVTSIANGNPTVFAKLVDENENVVTDADGEEIFDEITIASKAGFWQKFISFFKNLFGINRVIY